MDIPNSGNTSTNEQLGGEYTPTPDQNNTDLNQFTQDTESTIDNSPENEEIDYEASQDETFKELMKEGARRRDKKMRFSSDPNDPLYVTGKQLENAREEMEEDLSKREENEKTSPPLPITPEQVVPEIEADKEKETAETTPEDTEEIGGGWQKEFPEVKAKPVQEVQKTEKEKPSKIPELEPVDWVEIENEINKISDKELELAKNKATLGVSQSNRKFLHPFNKSPIMPRLGYKETEEAFKDSKVVKENGEVEITYKSGRKDEDTGESIYQRKITMSAEKAQEIEDLISQESERGMKHQEALESNRKANEGFVAGKPYQQNMKEALEDIKNISMDLKGKNFTESLSELMDKETAARYNKFMFNKFMNEDGTSPTEIPSTRSIYMDETNERLKNIDTSIEELDNELNQISEQLNNPEFLSDLDMEDLTQLLAEQRRLYSERNKLEREKYETVNSVAINTLLDRVSEPIEEEATEEKPVQAAVVAQDQVPESVKIEDQLGETPEQKSANLGRQLVQLDEIAKTRELTIEEKVIYFDLLKQKEAIDKEIGKVEEENTRRRKRKELIIKLASGGVGAGIALATPPVAVAAVIGVTLGGRFISKGLWKWKGLEKISKELRKEAKEMKYEDRSDKSPEELEEIDKIQKRKAKWADRLGEASAAIIGGTTGYGIGAALQDIFGWRIGGGKAPKSVPSAETTGGSNVAESPKPPVQAEPSTSTTTSSAGSEVAAEGSGTAGQEVVSEINAGLTSESLPDSMSLKELPEFTKGLEARGMPKDLEKIYFKGTEGGWADSQGDAFSKMLEMGVDTDSKEAGWALGEVAAKRVYNSAPITEETIKAALNKAAQTFGSN